MEIEVRIRKYCTDESRLKAVCSVVLGGMYMIHNVALVKRDSGEYFVSMPSLRDDYGVYRDVAHPINAESRKLLETAVIREYEEYIPV